VHGLGGIRVQGKTGSEAVKLLRDARALERAGAFALVLEMVPTAVAHLITQNLQIPTIGIGAGNLCDGQILVTDDLFGKFVDFQPRFVRHYAKLAETCREAVENYAKDVQAQSFPNADESFNLSAEEEHELMQLLTSEDVLDDSFKLAAKLGLSAE
jgi:3-methyl-2-oxobutanoate hydroxymethyltransferase